MQAGNVVDVAIEQIADGMPVDWNALQSGASDEDREFLKCLQVLDGLAGLHRSTDANSSAVDASVEETTDRLPEITSPTLVMYGEGDTVMGGTSFHPASSKVLADRIPNGELKVIPGGAHHIFWELPDQTNEAILEFLLRN